MSNNFDNTIHHGHSIVSAFNCPNCPAIAAQNPSKIKVNLIDQPNTELAKYQDYIIVLTCQSCRNDSIWIARKAFVTYNNVFDNNEDDYTKYEFEKLIFPIKAENAPLPNPDMPKNIVEIYNEACLVLKDSPRSSAALSRLAIEQLVDYLGAEGKDLNAKIGDLVSKGLPVTIQQMLDSVRVIGNNAVHPGQIEVEGNIDLAISLLTFINLIIDNQISQPKAIKSTYDLIPESYKKSIERRDKK